MNKYLWPMLCAWGLLAAVQPGAAQQVLHIPGVAGQSTVSHHVGDIDISGFGWSVTTPPPPPQGQSSSPPTFADLAVTKLVDTSSPTLAYACANHTVYSTGVKIYCTEPSNSGQIDFYTIVLGNCLVTGVTVNSQSGAGPITETITLHFTSISWTYVPLSGGNPQTAITSAYP